MSYISTINSSFDKYNNVIRNKPSETTPQQIVRFTNKEKHVADKIDSLYLQQTGNEHELIALRNSLNCSLERAADILTSYLGKDL